MFGQFAFGTSYFGQVVRPTGNFVLQTSGGVAIGGHTSLEINKCVCNLIVLQTSGGIALGGTATLEVQAASGGVSIGGKSTCRVLTDPWDGMAGVWLLGGSYNGTTGEVLDSTRNALNGTGGSGRAANTPTQDSGIGCRNSQLFSGKQWITLPQDRLISTQSMSVTLWANIAEYYRARTLFSRGFTTVDGDLWTLQLGYNFLNNLFASVNVIGSDFQPAERHVTGGSELERDRWYHLAVVWEPGDSIKVYVNGVLDGTTSVSETSLVVATNGSFIGRFNASQMPACNIEDVRLHPVARDAAWLQNEFASQCQSGFYSVGSESVV